MIRLQRTTVTGLRLVCLLLASALALRVGAAPRQGAWVNLADDRRLLYMQDDLGNRILDFSGCGYMGGQDGIPQVPARVVVEPAEGDDRARIQAAIDEVAAMSPDANGYRGAVLLGAGEYQVSATLNINASGVVLRGVGESETDGTRLRSTDTTGSVDNPTVLITIQGTGSTSGTGTTRKVTSKYVPAGTRSLDLDTAWGLSVGDAVMVDRPSTADWIAALGMDQLLNNGVDDYRWKAGDRDLSWQRTISRIEGNRIFLDAPIPTAIDALYGGGTVKKYTFAGRIEKCGIEGIRGISSYDPSVVDGSGNFVDENHAWVFIQIGAGQNCWVRNVTSRYFAYACVSLKKGTKWTSVLNCTSLEPVSLIDGGRRYAFPIDDAELCLVRGCTTQNDRHQFVTQSNTSGPHAFVNGASSNALSDAGPHQRWASGILWDCITVGGNSLDIQNRGNMGTGHGWAGANCVAWNCNAYSFDMENPPTARNWLVGSVGSISTSNSAAVPPNPDFGTFDANGTNVFPLSLWGNQCQDALAASGLQVREYVAGDFDRMNPETAFGDAASIEAAWSSAVSSAASAAGATTGNFDNTNTNRWIPWTHTFLLDPGDTVLSATLSFAVRSTANGWTNDVLRVESATNTLPLSGLGASSLGASNSTVLRCDLQNYISSLGDGKLNLAVSDNTAVDWAVLELRVVPQPSDSYQTTTIISEADTHVQGGTSATNNFGTNTSMLTKEASADTRRRAYVRWNFASVTNRIVEARIKLTTAGASTNSIENCAAVAGNNWSESAMNWNSQPAAQAPFCSWYPSTNNPVLDLNVTKEVREAAGKDGLLTLQLSSARDVGGQGIASYTTKEGTSSKRPQLVLTTAPAVNTAPIIAMPSGRTVAAGATISPVAVGLTDMESPPSTLGVTVSSSNPALVPNQPSNLNLSGTGNVRSLNISPVAGASGSTTITVTASDGSLSSSGTLVLSVASPLSARQIWWSEKFGAPEPGGGVSAATADPDGDSLSNILEYAFGSDPWVPDASGRTLSIARETNGFRLSYGPIATGVLDEVEAASDLSSGWSVPAGLNRTTNQSGIITALDALGIPLPLNRFYRVKLSVP